MLLHQADERLDSLLMSSEKLEGVVAGQKCARACLAFYMSLMSLLSSSTDAPFYLP